jgi:hypothetical protein
MTRKQSDLKLNIWRCFCIFALAIIDIKMHLRALMVVLISISPKVWVEVWCPLNYPEEVGTLVQFVFNFSVLIFVFFLNL